MQKEEEHRIAELNANNQEIELQESRLEKLNCEIDELQGEERHIQE